MATRIDTHRPSAIVPSEYEYVAPEALKIESLGDVQLVLQFREQIKKHMAKTGGTYSNHAHGGNCMVCGNAFAIYTVLFYHAATNTYVRMGQDCARQVDMGGEWDGDLNKLRRQVSDARERIAGKAKAKALLGDAGLAAVSEFVEALAAETIAENETHMAWRERNGIKFNSWGNLEWPDGVEVYDRRGDEPRYRERTYEERTIRDIHDTIVKTGRLSDRQASFLRSLLDRHAKGAEIAAARAKEREAAKEAPEGRFQVEGEILKTDTRVTDFGSRDVMTVKTVDGWVAWGSIPSGLTTWERGTKIRFTATFERSRNDAKFATFKRPVKAEVLS